MNKTTTIVNLFLLILCLLQFSAALKCYSCYSEFPGGKLQDFPFFRDNDLCGNDTTSYPVVTCASQCVYLDLENVETDYHYIVRACDPSGIDLCEDIFPPDYGISDCYKCGSDLCNMDETGFPPPPETCPSFIIDINLNINLNIN